MSQRLEDEHGEGEERGEGEGEGGSYDRAVVVDAHRERWGGLTLLCWMMWKGVEETGRLVDFIFDLKCGWRLC